MENCKNSVCGLVEECILKQYFLNHKKIDPVETADAFDMLQKECLIIEEIKKEYKLPLQDAQNARRKLRKNEPGQT